MSESDYPPQQPPSGWQPPGAPYPDPAYPPIEFRVTEAYNYGWRTFQQNVGTILLTALAWIGVLLAVFAVLGAVGGGVSALLANDVEQNAAGEVTAGQASFVAAILVVVLLGLLFGGATYVMMAGLIRGALHLTYGRRLRVGATFTLTNLGAVLLFTVLATVMNLVGLLFCGVGSLIVGFFLQFAMFFIVDKDMTAVEAIKASASLVNRKLGSMLGFYIASVIAYLVGTLLCYVGLLVAVPVVLIAQAYAYRVLQGETVAP